MLFRSAFEAPFWCIIGNYDGRNCSTPRATGIAPNQCGAQLLGVPRRTVANKLRELAASGAVTKEGSHYIANYEVFAATDSETAAHIDRMKEAVLSACEKLAYLEKLPTKPI